MLEILIVSVVGFVVGVAISKTRIELRDRKALRGKGLTIEKKLIAATIRLNAAERQNDEMRSYLGLNPVRREALVDDEPVASKKTRAKKKTSESDLAVEGLKGLGVGAGSMPMVMLMMLGTAMLVEQQKEKAKTNDKAKAKVNKGKLISDYAKFSSNTAKLKDIKSRLQKQAGELVDVLSGDKDSDLDK